MRTEPFRIHVTDETLSDLADRLSRTRWPDELAGAGWDYGTSGAYLRELVEYWRTAFDWRAQEHHLNTFHHFRARAGDLAIHFIHERGRGPAPLPIVVTHGWPGSFAEMVKIIPLLADPGAHGGDPDDAFDVVVPSMPGYGFSERPPRPGVSHEAIADLWAELMDGLGYARFGAQGGDWGAGVSTYLALRHAPRVTGLHLNYIPGSYQPYVDITAPPLSEAEQQFLVDRERWLRDEYGYGHLQATRPQTLAYGLNDSPAGLAAWIVEKLRAWSDCDGDLERRFTRDELLMHVMIYWVTGTIGSSIRLYRESRATPLALGPGQTIEVPTAVAVFPLEMPSPPAEWVARGYNLQRWTIMPRGGHFAAMEEPELLAEDIRAFFRPLRG
jgi:pimeloyl-ACP methyl ester carboxylesterase